MNPPKNRENSITSYLISEKNLIGDVKEKKSNYDLMTAVMICLGKNESTDTNVLKLLNVLLSTETDSEDKCQILEDDFKIKMTQTLESEVSLMCNLSKGVEEQGIQKGLQKGLEQGIQAMIATLKKLQIPTETILIEICEKFGLTREDAEKYLK